MIQKPATTLAEIGLQVPTSAFPIDAFSADLQDVFRFLQGGNKVPSELIANILLASISLACQSLAEVKNPWNFKTEPCALYLATLAESGMGKTTIKDQVMAPFYIFAAAIKQDYKSKFAAYEHEFEVWNTTLQALRNNLRAAIKKGGNVDDEQTKLKLHGLKAPKKPLDPDIIFNDVSPVALIEGMRRYSSAGLITDEAITFFSNNLKDFIRFLNSAWDGGIYNYSRGNRESCSIAPILTMLLMVQPAICFDYLKKQGTTAKASGFLSRILFIRVPSQHQTVAFGYRYNATPHFNDETVLIGFHNKINTFLAAQKAQIESGKMDKTQLTLDAEACAFWEMKREHWVNMSKPHQQWSYISDMVQKANTNALRIAGMFHYYCNSSSQIITLATMERAACIMEWYLNHAASIFYEFTPEYQFELDAQELKMWIYEKIHYNNGVPVKKNFVLKYGPNRLRKSDKLDSLLGYLASNGLVCSVQSHPNNPVYISAPNAAGIILPPPDMPPLGQFVILPPYQPARPAGF